PDEYIENNPAAHSLHDNRDPMQSAQIIIAHVHDGIQMARQFRLPQRVIDFIPQHHGNDLVKFFYHKARRLAQERGEDPDSVSESAFRYPGPKPHSREAAVVMMADTIDAASRTLTNPTPEKLRTFTHNLMMDKLGSGQLDDCGLTFHDLNLCEEAFLRVLAARYHQRIRYPGQELTEGDDLAGSTMQMRQSKLGGVAAAPIMPVRIDAPARREGGPSAATTPLVVAPASAPNTTPADGTDAQPDTGGTKTLSGRLLPVSGNANADSASGNEPAAGSGTGGGGSGAGIPSPRRRQP
ncbi:MAG TPA: HDIG domain-containing protein, partial [Planctomycetota bacterium]|nr:HDIG domain-containing protein [Planctomycetota bacterium]